MKKFTVSESGKLDTERMYKSFEYRIYRAREGFQDVNGIEHPSGEYLTFCSYRSKYWPNWVMVIHPFRTKFSLDSLILVDCDVFDDISVYLGI